MCKEDESGGPRLADTPVGQKPPGAVPGQRPRFSGATLDEKRPGMCERDTPGRPGCFSAAGDFSSLSSESFTVIQPLAFGPREAAFAQHHRPPEGLRRWPCSSPTAPGRSPRAGALPALITASLVPQKGSVLLCLTRGGDASKPQGSTGGTCRGRVPESLGCVHPSGGPRGGRAGVGSAGKFWSC